MTGKRLNRYYEDNCAFYKELTRSCSSIIEIRMRLDSFGRTWSQWDWAVFFMCMSAFMRKDSDSIKYLLEDVIESIRTSIELDDVVTNRTVVLALADMSREDIFISRILAAAFEKFPALWTMQYMFRKYKGRVFHIIDKNVGMKSPAEEIEQSRNSFVKKFSIFPKNV